MNRASKEKFLLIPTAVFPYATVAVLGLYFLSGFFSAAVERFVHENLAAFGIAVAAIFVLAIVCNIIYILSSRKTPAKALIKTAFIIKCIQIPAYAAIFIFGLLLGFMFIMTFPLIMFLVFLDLLSLFLSNFISLSALIRRIRSRKGGRGIFIAAAFCQPFFCADVISLFAAASAEGRQFNA